MKTYKGEIKVLGKGYSQVNRMGRTRTKRAVVEIGDHVLRNVITDDLIETYLNVGDEVEVLTASFLGSKAIVAIKVEGKSYKMPLFKVSMDILIPIMVLFVLIPLLFDVLSYNSSAAFIILLIAAPFVFHLIVKVRFIRAYFSF